MSNEKTALINGKEYTKDEFLKIIGGDVGVFNDVELLVDLDALTEGNGLKIGPVFKRLAGAQYKTVLEDLRDPKTGRVTVENATDFVMKLMESVSPNS